MSHFTTIRTQVRDIAALRAACAELGLELAQNATARGYAGNGVSLPDLNAEIRDAYGVGGLYDLSRKQASALLDRLKGSSRKAA